ncbi:hypothetical protein PHLCEN_2v10590 [Hermanssonia centrifuga]|uniref:Ribosomal protein L19 n=1 Tax=Hermanssonia centrifuga TaxID=98765 RepID=A0A2R6NMS5_9APHY|nr:hypothetical protein PHLCEN_2v10590 [Hermanssonia centrifuga]
MFKLLNPLRQGARSLTTAASNYPFSNVVKFMPPPSKQPTAPLLVGKGLMTYLQETLPTPEKLKFLATYFSKRHPERILPGCVLTVFLNHAPTSFSGVVTNIRYRGADTSFVLRNIINRTGVEMQFYVNSPHLKDIKVIQRPGGGLGAKSGPTMRRAKLFYLRDSPSKMTAISAGLRG